MIGTVDSVVEPSKVGIVELDAGEQPSPWCTTPVPRPVMLHRWDELTFLHWRYDPDEIQRLLPDGLRVHMFDGSAWVGLVPFVMAVTVPGVPAVPWVSRFPETNVRTYAVAPDGSTGVWFLSLDAARLAAVITARVTYRLPYYWSRMNVAKVGNVITYRSRRRWPGLTRASSEAAVQIGDPYRPDELTDLDHWLTARFGLHANRLTGLRHARAAHQPWPLHRATVLDLDGELMTAAGLTPPVGPPLAHWSPGVAVRVSLPHRVLTP
jgi:uncharacterized protein YqjF (DUF2071 family)